MKTKQNQKWKIPHTLLERRTLCFSAYKNRQLKLNCDDLELAKEKREHTLYLLFCAKDFFNICVLSQCILY